MSTPTKKMVRSYVDSSRGWTRYHCYKLFYRQPRRLIFILLTGSIPLILLYNTATIFTIPLGIKITNPDHPLPRNIEKAVWRHHPTTIMDHLIIVAGHSITVSENNIRNAETDETVWWLADYMKGTGVHQAFVEHIRIALREGAKDPNSLIVLSGGEIEENASYGSLSVGNSYIRVALALGLLQPKSELLQRTVTEEFSRDSYENLLFSICRFKEVVGIYPKRITVVGFSFKRYRFEHMHIPAISFPSHKFQYLGYDPPEELGFDVSQSTRGEMENARKYFEVDPYGCLSTTLREKRQNRNPFGKTPPYPLSCPELRPLLDWCGPTLYTSSSNYNILPWEISS